MHFIIILFFLGVLSVQAQVFQFPTANRSLLQPGGEAAFFAGTAGKSWESGQFGCVRTYGNQFHEGWDIRYLTRDRKGEPTDAVCSTAAGTVAYINSHPGLSNYGKYIILRHVIDGIEIYSLYGHLSQIREGLKAGQSVTQGEPIAVMGRTTNTRERIDKDRAHVHFELNLLVNDRFSDWYKRYHRGERNDHGDWNGQNLIGIDPRVLVLAQNNPQLSLLQYIKGQTEFCRVRVRATNFAWVRRYPMLVKANPATEKEGIAGYDASLNFNGLPYELTPLPASEIRSKQKIQLVSVNSSEIQRSPCGHLVSGKAGRWSLSTRGENLLGLLTY